ncbi:MAG: ribonuclease H-like domain-containing protein [Alphaproteobacteria bacterium]|nr:ribonuclease H-like domain-containing protein [Alphaproteobacteria bacterium]MCD8526502.1 ribonuclease H-like domain-containing protein [Alphaproteobacteria bacterium]MCD8570357.1 ribonuclease H-like domain-containing protein [Alphaproteobacteria bacterium]
MTNITLHHGDLPDNLDLGDIVAVDTETMGLKYKRDRLCLVQLSSGDGHAHLVQLNNGDYKAPNLKALLSDAKTLKIFHYARFDIVAIKTYLGVDCQPVYCTRTASKLARTYTDRHGLKDICKELLDIDISKNQQSSDWGATELSPDQLEYAANDVYHLHKLKDKLDVMLKREGRDKLARMVFDAMPMRAALDIAGWRGTDIFEH